MFRPAAPPLPVRRALPAILVFAALTFLSGDAPVRADNTAQAFANHSGVPLVFANSDLPRGRYFDRMPELTTPRRSAAARLLEAEGRKYPRGYLAALGLKRVAVFEACIADDGDGFRAYDQELGGYPYFGLFTGGETVIACYYTDSQLPLTFHHEVFHAVDRAIAKRIPDHAARWSDAVTLAIPHPPVALDTATLRAIAARAPNRPLKDAVSAYAAKNPGEDRAETARWFMTNLSDGMLQAARHPELSGTQRIIELLGRYHDATSNGPDIAWFAALARGDEQVASTPADASYLSSLTTARVRDDADIARIRSSIDELAARDLKHLPTPMRLKAMSDAANLVPRLVRVRLRVDPNDAAFTVWKPSDGDLSRGNPVLREDVRAFGADATRIARLHEALGDPDAATVVRVQHDLLRLLARYRDFIASNWPMSQTTASVFDATRSTIAAAIPKSSQALRTFAAQASWHELANATSAAATPSIPAKPAIPAAPSIPRTNPHLAKVDATISDPAVRAAIRAVQPATVKVGGGSGVNLAATGLILTNAHVAKALGRSFTVTFPDGSHFSGRTTAIDDNLDLALVTLEGASGLPVAPVATKAPIVGTPVIVIGQPGSSTPDGEATGYQPFHVSTGRIRKLLPNPLGPQSLGRAGHDAWTYWGHSGSPLFNTVGAIVALHNSWDATTAMRHAVPWQAITHFLAASGARVLTR